MNIKLRFALLFSLFVSLILFLTFLVIYLLYAGYRKEEFYTRLEQKARTTSRFLLEVQEIDLNLLKIIDRNTLNALYDEKVLIFDKDNKLIYSSIDDLPVHYSDTLLKKIVTEKRVIYEDGKNEIIGLLIEQNGNQNKVIASAFDKYGKIGLKNLRNTLLISGGLGLLIAALLSYFYIRQFFYPLEALNAQIQAISEKNLKERLAVPLRAGELSELAENFNRMLDRLEKAFRMQKNFVQYASHELRTPLANLVSQTETALYKDLSQDEYKKLVNSLYDDHKSLIELTNSLLLLSRYENVVFPEEYPLLRVDEVLYETAEEIKIIEPDFDIKIDFTRIPEDEKMLTIKGNETLLRTAFKNLIKNACRYSSDNKVNISIDAKQEGLSLRFLNKGEVLKEEEIENMFVPFFRGENARHRKGFGLGLAVTRQILEVHHAEISYVIPDCEINLFVIEFHMPKPKKIK
jgi:signal transduction histidine kinase